jgi:bifunctional DNA-binding transcriptional regulator/antitoxin component of YhaV-PrlF toxin-antitoxin module
VTASFIPPLIPRSSAADRSGAGLSGRSRRPLPVPSLDPGTARAAANLYVVSAVDKSGRVADRSAVRALGWAAGTRVTIRERGGTIVVAPATDGVHRIDDRGYLLLPLAVRRWCRLATGDRLLLVADPATKMLDGALFRGARPTARRHPRHGGAGRGIMSQTDSGRPELAAARLMLSGWVSHRGTCWTSRPVVRRRRRSPSTCPSSRLRCRRAPAGCTARTGTGSCRRGASGVSTNRSHPRSNSYEPRFRPTSWLDATPEVARWPLSIWSHRCGACTGGRLRTGGSGKPTTPR